MRKKRQHRKRRNSFKQSYLAWFHRTKPCNSQPFDPTLLVELARDQWSDHPQLADAFAQCTRQWPESELYTYLLDPAYVSEGAANQWFFAGNLALDHPKLGTLVVDVLHADEHRRGPQRIGGIEYLDKVMGRPTWSAGELKMLLLQCRAEYEARKAGN